MTLLRPLLLPAILSLAVLSSAAYAHSTIKATTPKSGAVLSSSPPEIVLELNEAARLTSLVAVAPDGSERKLAFEPSGSAKRFTASAPQLPDGRNEVRWKALSRDGHPVGGKIIIVIKPER